MRTKIELEYPYNTTWKSGYLNTNKENRRTLALYNTPTDRSSTQYARYLMAVKLGRFLHKHEQVDHINNDKTDDRLDNLRVLSQYDNIRKSKTAAKWYTAQCPVCNKVFDIEHHNISHRVASTCSRSCGGKLPHIDVDVKMIILNTFYKHCTDLS